MAGTIQSYGRYSLVRRIARGGMAEIFEARVAGPGGFDKRVAVKRLHANLAEDQLFVGMLTDEARITAHLSHPNICQVLDFGLEGGTYFISMELIEGCDLGSLARRARKMGLDLSWGACAYIAREAAEGLAYAHALCDDDGRPFDVVHRDISPQNILVSCHGEVKVCDFGIAKATARLASTQAGVLKGKFCYMAPEQARGEPLDGRADVFALGIVLFELVSGRALYPQTFTRENLDLIRRGGYPPLRSVCPTLPEGLEQVLARALAVSRSARPGARELADLLTEAMRDNGWEFDRSALANLMQTAVPELVRVPTGEDAGETKVWPGSERLGEATDQQLGTGDLEASSSATVAATPGNLREPEARSSPPAPPARRTPRPVRAAPSSPRRRSALDPRRRPDVSERTEALPEVPSDVQPAAALTTRLTADDRPIAAAPPRPPRSRRAGPWLLAGVLVAGAATGVAFALNAPLLLGGTAGPSAPVVALPGPAPFVPFAVPDAGLPVSDAGAALTKTAGSRHGRGPRPRGTDEPPPDVTPTVPDEPAEPAAAVPLTIAAVPTGVVTVDGRRAGRTPVTVRVSAGRHNVVVEGADGRRAVRTVYAGREPQTVFVNLE